MDSTQAFLQEYISDRIPITSAMGISVTEVSPLSITVAAKLAPNINHRDSAFGGSISTLAILAGWIILKHRCQAFEPRPTLVIQASSVQFLKPIVSDYEAQTVDLTETDFAKFERAYQRYGKARLTLKSTVTCESSSPLKRAKTLTNFGSESALADIRSKTGNLFPVGLSIAPANLSNSCSKQ